MDMGPCALVGRWGAIRRRRYRWLGGTSARCRSLLCPGSLTFAADAGRGFTPPDSRTAFACCLTTLLPSSGLGTLLLPWPGDWPRQTLLCISIVIRKVYGLDFCLELKDMKRKIKSLLLLTFPIANA